MLKTADGACVMAVIVHFCAELSKDSAGYGGKLLTLIFPDWPQGDRVSRRRLC